MNSNSENKIETIEQFREWLHNLGEIKLANGQTHKPLEFGSNGDPSKLTPEDELVMFNELPVGTTENEWFKKLAEWIESYTEGDLDCFYGRHY